MLGMAIRGQFGSYISRLGDGLQSPGLIYNSWTLDSFHRLALEAAPTVVDGVMKMYPNIRSAVDWGCGTGPYVAEFIQRGVACEGYEYLQKVRDVGKKRLGLDCHSFDLASPEPWDGSQYDLAISIEVAEHLPPELGERLVDVCTKSAQLVVFSAAVPGQGGQGHVNEQPPEYWRDRFERRGFIHREDRTAALAEHLRENLIRAFYLARNMMVFEESN